MSLCHWHTVKASWELYLHKLDVYWGELLERQETNTHTHIKISFKMIFNGDLVHDGILFKELWNVNVVV